MRKGSALWPTWSSRSPQHSLIDQPMALALFGQPGLLKLDRMNFWSHSRIYQHFLRRLQNQTTFIAREILICIFQIASIKSLKIIEASKPSISALISTIESKVLLSFFITKKLFMIVVSLGYISILHLLARFGQQVLRWSKMGWGHKWLLACKFLFSYCIIFNFYLINSFQAILLGPASALDQSLSLAYGNRAAAYFQVKMYV